MRKYTVLENVDQEVKKIMLYSRKEEVYIFLYNTEEDTGCFADRYYSSVEDAIEEIIEEYGINESDWIEIDDPLEYCQHDIIRPVRVKGRADGNPQWGILEELLDGKWVEL